MDWRAAQHNVRASARETRCRYRRSASHLFATMMAQIKKYLDWQPSDGDGLRINDYVA
jgi:hypothetical protein